MLGIAVNDIDFFGDGIVSRQHIEHLMLRLLGCVPDLLHPSEGFQLENLQIVTFIRQTVDTLPEKQLQEFRNSCRNAGGEIVRVVEHGTEPPFMIFERDQVCIHYNNIYLQKIKNRKCRHEAGNRLSYYIIKELFLSVLVIQSDNSRSE